MASVLNVVDNSGSASLGSASTYLGRYPGGSGFAQKVVGSTVVAGQRDTSSKIWWNPPAHLMTKPPRIEWMDGTIKDWSFKDDQTRTYNGVNTGKDLGTLVKGRLGAIYTYGSDAGGARWGVQFHYNPAALSMTAAGLDDPALTIEGYLRTVGEQNLLGTFGQMSLEVYFNRIYDVNYPGDHQYPQALSPAYGPKKTESQGSMLRRLGTQYDVEYLFRAANGDPSMDVSLGYETADKGVVIQRPVVLSLGPFVYRGVLNSIAVNHIMFTPNMVPTFTSVSLGFTRWVNQAWADEDRLKDEASTASTEGSSASTGVTVNDGVEYFKQIEIGGP
jgi:hypothetical protein